MDSNESAAHTVFTRPSGDHLGIDGMGNRHTVSIPQVSSRTYFKQLRWEESLGVGVFGLWGSSQKTYYVTVSSCIQIDMNPFYHRDFDVGFGEKRWSSMTQQKWKSKVVHYVRQ